MCFSQLLDNLNRFKCLFSYCQGEGRNSSHVVNKILIPQQGRLSLQERHVLELFSTPFFGTIACLYNGQCVWQPWATWMHAWVLLLWSISTQGENKKIVCGVGSAWNCCKTQLMQQPYKRKWLVLYRTIRSINGLYIALGQKLAIFLFKKKIKINTFH